MWITKPSGGAAIGAIAKVYNELMYGESDLTSAQREMIAITVSTLNGCEY